MPLTNSTAQAALDLARRGSPVLPCYNPTPAGCSCSDPACASPGKHPRTRRGLHAATIDLSQVRRWWRAWPDANVAVRTGARPNGAGVVVLDVDARHRGEDSLLRLVDEHGSMPDTLEVATGSGRHLWFAHPGGTVPNSAGRLGLGLDVRGDGGYVLVPPSRHSSGSRYRWQRLGQPAPLPAWLRSLLEPPPVHAADPAAQGPVRDVGTWAIAALRDEAANVRTALEGHRNDTLNRAAFRLGQLVGVGQLDPDTVTVDLTAAALDAGLTLQETRATIGSGLRAGTARPRTDTRPSTGPAG